MAYVLSGQIRSQVDGEPARAGIDPLNKLIDRDGNDNVVAVEKGGDIRIYDIRRGPGHIEMVARVTREAIAAHFVGVPNPVADAEPEAVGIAEDSSFALVTLQDCSSVAALELGGIERCHHQGLAPEAVGDRLLRSVVHLPYGYVGSNGGLFCSMPSGLRPM